jgi:hypothetical protein
MIRSLICFVLMATAYSITLSQQNATLTPAQSAQLFRIYAEPFVRALPNSTDSWGIFSALTCSGPAQLRENRESNARTFATLILQHQTILNEEATYEQDQGDAIQWCLPPHHIICSTAAPHAAPFLPHSEVRS